MITNKSTNSVKTKSTGSKQVLDKKLSDDKSRKRGDVKHSVIKKDITESVDKSMDNLVIDKKSTPKNKGGKPSKKNTYSIERQEVYDKLWTILGITNDKMEYSLTDLEKDQVKQKQILELADDIKKYFSCGTWPYYAKPEIKDKYLSLAKSLLREQGYNSSYSRILDGKTNRVIQKTIQLTKTNIQ